MKQVLAYQAADGSLHATEIAALDHETTQQRTLLQDTVAVNLINLGFANNNVNGGQKHIYDKHQMIAVMEQYFKLQGNRDDMRELIALYSYSK